MDEFEKVSVGIFNKVEENKRIFLNKFIDDLEELFPETVKDGIVDFQALLDRFGEYEEVSREKYNMTWIGKNKAIQEADEDIYGRTLKYVPEESKNPETTENVYIEGDNLEVLKLLRQSYYGKIKMIYIDPPYNTGNDFIYKDNFTMKKEKYEKVSGEVDEHGERLVKNSSDSGRFHSDWLNMMYPRLKIAKDLLKEDGVIFISIDDNELHNMRKICDEIFSERNFVGCICRATGTTTGQDANKIGSSLDYCLVYSKSTVFKLKGLPMNDSDMKRFNASDEKGRYSTLQLRKTGNSDTKEDRPNMFYPVLAPDGSEVYPFGPTGYLSRWRVAKSTYIKLEADNMIVWKKVKQFEHVEKDGCIKSQWIPYVKYYLEGRTKQVSNLFQDIEGNKKGSLVLKKIFDNKGIFDNPKPVQFLEILFKIATENQDCILDFFSGSSTTAHSIMKLNAEDGGRRKYIMVQLPEETDENSEAYKAGYKNIAEIGKERIRRAGEIIVEQNKDKEGIENLDIGFKVFKTEDTNLKMIRDTISEGLSIEEHKALSKKDRIDFNPHFTDIDVVYEMILRRQDIDLSEDIDLLDQIGNRTYLIGHTVLVCLEENITEEMVTKIGEIGTDLSWIIMRDSAFEDNINLKLNTVKLLKSVVKENHNKEQKIYWI